MIGTKQHSLSTCRRIVFLCLVALALTGCSHRVLTFFFTGVPDPNAVQVEELTATLETQTEATQVVAEQRHIPDQPWFTHGPWISRQCDSCHAAKGGSRSNIVGADAGSLQRLSFKEKGLCISCHVDSEFDWNSNSLFIHGPIANGDCLECHNPHKSTRQFLLLAANNRDLCAKCHSGVDNRPSEMHRAIGDQDCVVCHNPHSSELPMLLRARVRQ